MAQVVAEISEAQAEGKTKATFDDIKSTLRVPSVGKVFLELAVYPDYLQTAWTALKPNVQIVHFEQEADTLRRAAVEEVAELGAQAQSDPQARASVLSAHYAAPKLLLATALLRAATSGSQPQMLTLRADQKRRVPAGVPEGMAPVLDDLSEDEHGLAALAERPEFAKSMRAMSQRAGRVATGLPFRMDIAPHTLRHSGLSESEIDNVRDVLDRSYFRGLEAVLRAAFLATATQGRDAAAGSPFPLRLDAQDGSSVESPTAVNPSSSSR